ncbi:MAG: GNAT family N-acetyltransferase [Microscillaceae bacterium]|nr:GNAT family N-acetyltransferase [Microscillaceae bacterium]
MKDVGISLEAAHPRDYAAIATIYNEYILEGNQTMEEKTHQAWDILQWTSKFNEREQLYTLKRGDEVLGWGIIKRYSDRAGYAKTCETSVYLRKNELRQGYGTWLKRKMIEKCRELGYHHLVARVLAHNLSSIEYNRMLGYEVVGTQKEIGFKNGRWVDVVIMQLILD